jgi:hypothetical protein
MTVSINNETKGQDKVHFYSHFSSPNTIGFILQPGLNNFEQYSCDFIFSELVREILKAWFKDNNIINQELSKNCGFNQPELLLLAHIAGLRVKKHGRQGSVTYQTRYDVNQNNSYFGVVVEGSLNEFFGTSLEVLRNKPDCLSKLNKSEVDELRHWFKSEGGADNE